MYDIRDFFCVPCVCSMRMKNKGKSHFKHGHRARATVCWMLTHTIISEWYHIRFHSASNILFNVDFCIYLLPYICRANILQCDSIFPWAEFVRHSFALSCAFQKSLFRCSIHTHTNILFVAHFRIKAATRGVYSRFMNRQAECTHVNLLHTLHYIWAVAASSDTNKKMKNSIHKILFNI